MKPIQIYSKNLPISAFQATSPNLPEPSELSYSEFSHDMIKKGIAGYIWNASIHKKQANFYC